MACGALWGFNLLLAILLDMGVFVTVSAVACVACIFWAALAD